MGIDLSVASAVVIVSSCGARSSASSTHWESSALVGLVSSCSSSESGSALGFSSSGASFGGPYRNGAYAASLAPACRTCLAEFSLPSSRIASTGVEALPLDLVGLGLTGLLDLLLIVLDGVPGGFLRLVSRTDEAGPGRPFGLFWCVGFQAQIFCGAFCWGFTFRIAELRLLGETSSNLGSL